MTKYDMNRSENRLTRTIRLIISDQIWQWNDQDVVIIMYKEDQCQNSPLVQCMQTGRHVGQLGIILRLRNKLEEIIYITIITKCSKQIWTMLIWQNFRKIINTTIHCPMSWQTHSLKNVNKQIIITNYITTTSSHLFCYKVEIKTYLYNFHLK